MMIYLKAMGIILAVFAGWVVVQQLARRFAVRHPEFGPAREEGGGCGKTCGCSVQQRTACEQDQVLTDGEKESTENERAV